MRPPSRPAVIPGLLALVAGCLILPAPTLAEQPGASEAGVGVGIRFGGRLSGRQDPDTGEKLNDLYVASGLSFGASFGYWVSYNVILEALWSSQPTNIENRDPMAQDEETIDVDVTINDFLIGASIHGGRAYDRIRWWGGAHIGATTYHFDSGTQTRFGAAASLGTRSPISTHWRFVTHARSRWSYLDQTQDFFCDANDNCYSFPRTNWLQQWDFGVSFRYIF